MHSHAPSADDDNSETFVILEALRVLLMDERVKDGEAESTIGFHCYAAVEDGWLGIQAVFEEYMGKERRASGMLQVDMVGYVDLDSEAEESFEVAVDCVDDGLTEFVKKIISAYCTIPYIETECGYTYFNHASALKAGYPSAFVIESAIGDTSGDMHSPHNKVDELSFSYMLEHGKMAAGFAYELGFTSYL